MEPLGQNPLVVNGIIVSPFEEEEEGTSIASDAARGKRRGVRHGAAVRYGCFCGDDFDLSEKRIFLFSIFYLSFF